MTLRPTPKFPRRVAFSMVVAATTGLIACGADSQETSERTNSPASASRKPCNKAGCSDGAIIYLRSKAEWQPGSYGFVLEADDKRTIVCKGSLSRTDCRPHDIFAKCNENGREISNVRILRSSCVSRDGLRYRYIAFYSVLPQKKVSVQITHNGRQLVNEVVRLSYRSYFPNGEDCEPECQVAQHALDVPATPGPGRSRPQPR